MQPAEQDHHESVLERANSLLSAFGPRHRSLTLSGIVMRTGLPKSTVHRTAQQMIRLGWLTYESGHYSLGTRLFELSGLSDFRHELREVALPFMQDLYEASHVTVHLGTRVGLEVLYVEKISGHDKVTELSRVGGRMPIHCTALGKAILAFSPPEILDQVIDAGLTRYTGATICRPMQLRQELQRIADMRVSFDRQESSVGICCVASPVFGPDQQVVAAISVTGSVNRAGLDRIAPSVLAAATGISRSLAGETSRSPDGRSRDGARRGSRPGAPVREYSRT
jgi:DNA-binding IclR family transcriptional regulator